MNDPRPLYARATGQLAALIKTVRPEQLEHPTPCAEFDVRALLAHVVGGAHRIAVVGEGGDALSQPVDIEPVADDEWSVAYDQARERAYAAWTPDDRLAAQVTMPWGTLPGAGALQAHVMETATHTWDLSRALGEPVVLDQEIAEVALESARRMVAADRRGQENGVPFEAPREAGADADAYERLAAWLGRDVQAH
ncbi:TIGR03086 family metal-binding protein [Streptomyces sp. NPDC001941]|uniref:TIGR03086 family metal-binding protein n=1 Tax=Streptomyces sp. NPDC001941 TaxID=3154659 RepID=UPI003330AF2C